MKKEKKETLKVLQELVENYGGGVSGKMKEAIRYHKKGSITCPKKLKSQSVSRGGKWGFNILCGSGS